MNAQQKALRISRLETKHAAVLTALSSTPQTIAQIATAVGISQDETEKKLSILVDEGLASRTVGDRTTARYTAA